MWLLIYSQARFYSYTTLTFDYVHEINRFPLSAIPFCKLRFQFVILKQRSSENAINIEVLSRFSRPVIMRFTQDVTSLSRNEKRCWIRNLFNRFPGRSFVFTYRIEPMSMSEKITVIEQGKISTKLSGIYNLFACRRFFITISEVKFSHYLITESLCR